MKTILLALAAMLAVAATASASTRGGFGIVTPFRVGPLIVDGSTDANVRAFAGNPNRVTYANNGGVLKTFVYRFPAHGLTEYAFSQSSDGTWYLEQFYTTLQRFRTQRGTKVGMTVGEAQRREHLRYRSGCVAGLSRTFKVSGLYYTLYVATYRGRVRNLELDGPFAGPC